MLEISDSPSTFIQKVEDPAEAVHKSRAHTGADDTLLNQDYIMPTQTTSLAAADPVPMDETCLARFGHGPVLPVPHSLVHEAFESIVGSTPTAIAAKFNEDSITYEQLDIAANRLAHHLIDSGLKPRQRVCIVVQRSFEMLVGIFAVLKAGCQYVPIDGGVASEQALKHILVDTGARFILCLPRYWDKVCQLATKDAVIISLEANTGAFYSTDRPAIKIRSTDGAYAIYTSGKMLRSNATIYSNTPPRKHGDAERRGRFTRQRYQRPAP